MKIKKNIAIEQWIDIDGADFKRLEHSVLVRKSIMVGVENNIIQVDLAGYMWQGESPLYAELDGKNVGLRYAAKALN